MEFEGLKYSNRNPAPVSLRDSDNSVLTTDASAKHEFYTLLGKVFHGANAAGTPVATQAGLSATTPALTLYNPANSGVNLVLLKVNIGITADPAAESTLMLAYNLTTAAAPTSTTDATMVSGMIGSATAPAGRCYRVATLATAPVAFRYLGSVLAASSTSFSYISENIDGEVVVPPGGCISVQATSAVSVLCSFTWKEVSTS